MRADWVLGCTSAVLDSNRSIGHKGMGCLSRFLNGFGS